MVTFLADILASIKLQDGLCVSIRILDACTPIIWCAWCSTSNYLMCNFELRSRFWSILWLPKVCPCSRLTIGYQPLMSSNLAMKHGNLHGLVLFNFSSMWWSVCFSCLQGSHICHEWQGTKESWLGEMSSWVKRYTYN